MWKRNLIVLTVTVLAILVLSVLGSTVNPLRRPNLSTEFSIAIIAVVFAFIAFGAFFGFGGGFWTRTILATLAPAVALPLGELIFVISGSPDDGYRWRRIGRGVVSWVCTYRGSDLSLAPKPTRTPPNPSIQSGRAVSGHPSGWRRARPAADFER